MQRFENFEYVLTVPCHDESLRMASDVPALSSAA